MPMTKEKKKLVKLIQQSDSDDSEHELSYYVNDRVKLMKEVLKTVKPKKIKAMAPACLKDVDIEEVNSMLLEELLGISNKRLKYIFNGQNLDEDSSSSTNEDEPIDVISLDDISDDEFVINLDDDDKNTGKNPKKVKKEHKHCKMRKNKNIVKTEKSPSKSKEKQKHEKEKGETEKQGTEGVGSNENLMSVLELLELQARARAIKSQLLLENAKTQESISTKKNAVIEEKIGSDDDIIIETIKTEEIIITSTESEDEAIDKRKKKKTYEKSKEASPEAVNKGTIQTLNTEAGGTKELEKFESHEEGSNKDVKNTESNESSNQPKELSKTENTEISKETKTLTDSENRIEEQSKPPDSECKSGKTENKDKTSRDTEKDSGCNSRLGKEVDNDEIVVINLSDDEID